jgi:multiple sugar transport system substrate-binding protein
MKRVIFFAVFLMLSSMVCLAAGSKEGTKAEPAKGVLKITTWQFQEPTGGDVWNVVQKQFEEKYPNVKVERIEAAGGTYWTKIFVDVVSGSPPDVMHVTMPDLQQMKGMQVLEPLDNWMDTSEIRKTFVKEQTTMCAEGGKIDGLITGGRTLQLIVNKKLFNQAGAKPPATQTELKEAASRIRALGGDIYGLILETNDENFENTYEYLLSFVAGQGGNFVRNGKPTTMEPEVIKGVSLYKELVDADVAPVGLPVNVHREMFFNGKIGMYIDGPWNFAIIEKQNPDLYPAMDALDNPWPNKAAIGGPNHILVIPKGAANKAMAGNFINLWSSQEIQRLYYEKLGVVPGRLDAVPPEALQKRPWFKAYLDGAASAVPAIPEGLEKRTVEVQKAVVDSLGKVLFRNQPVGAAMQELQSVLNTIANKE